MTKIAEVLELTKGLTKEDLLKAAVDKQSATAGHTLAMLVVAIALEEVNDTLKEILVQMEKPKAAKEAGNAAE